MTTIPDNSVSNFHRKLWRDTDLIKSRFLFTKAQVDHYINNNFIKCVKYESPSESIQFDRNIHFKFKQNFQFATDLNLELTLPALPEGLVWKNKIGLLLIKEFNLETIHTWNSDLLKFNYFCNHNDWDIFDYDFEERVSKSKNPYKLTIPLNVFNDEHPLMRPFICSILEYRFKIVLSNLYSLIEYETAPINLDLKLDYKFSYNCWFSGIFNNRDLELMESNYYFNKEDLIVPKDIKPCPDLEQILSNAITYEILIYDFISTDVNNNNKLILNIPNSIMNYHNFYIKVFNLDTRSYENCIKNLSDINDNYTNLRNYSILNYSDSQLEIIQSNFNLDKGYYCIPLENIYPTIDFNFEFKQSGNYKIDIYISYRNEFRYISGMYGVACQM